MIIVTGGAGFIGSALVWKLNQLGEDNILIVDHLEENEKWKNLCQVRFADYLEKEEFLRAVVSGGFNEASIKAIFHLGACSSTTEQNASYLIQNNYEYSKKLAEFAVKRDIRFVYASSAATYGSGENGYGDDEKRLQALIPLNAYGFSKHMMDLWACRHGFLKKIAGLKYFNVFGPNEYHKGEMRSMVLKGFEQIRDTGRVKLFKSYRSDYADGEQVRDFLYVKDAVDMTLFFMEHPKANGIFNIGSGVATSWNEMMGHLFRELEKEPDIEYINMPESLRSGYQYNTQADIGRICRAGYQKPIQTMGAAMKDYVGYLLKNSYIGS